MPTSYEREEFLLRVTYDRESLLALLADLEAQARTMRSTIGAIMGELKGEALSED